MSRGRGVAPPAVAVGAVALDGQQTAKQREPSEVLPSHGRYEVHEHSHEVTALGSVGRHTSRGTVVVRPTLALSVPPTPPTGAPA